MGTKRSRKNKNKNKNKSKRVKKRLSRKQRGGMVFKKNCSSSVYKAPLESTPLDFLTWVFNKHKLDNLQKMVTFLEQRLRLREGDLFKMSPGELQVTPRFFVQIVPDKQATSTTEKGGSMTLTVADLQSNTSDSTEEIFYEIEDKHNEVAVAFEKKPFTLLRLSLFGLNLSEKEEIAILNLASVAIHFHKFENLRLSLFVQDEAMCSKKKVLLLKLLREIVEKKKF